MAIGSIMPFRPTETVTLAASTTSGSVALTGGGDSVVVTNLTTSVAYVRFGSDATVPATTADMPVLPNAKVMLGVNPFIRYAMAILVSGSGSLLLTAGTGRISDGVPRLRKD